jgi:hypothetical protein
LLEPPTQAAVAAVVQVQHQDSAAAMVVQVLLF